MRRTQRGAIVSGVKPLSEGAKRIIALAETHDIEEVVKLVHTEVLNASPNVPISFALKMLQEIGELRNKVEPQNADRELIVRSLEAVRIRLQTQADELHDRHDYSAEFPQREADDLAIAIAILTMPKEMIEAQFPPVECWLIRQTFVEPIDDRDGLWAIRKHRADAEELVAYQGKQAAGVSYTIHGMREVNLDRDNAVQAVFDCILRGINDLSIPGMQSYAHGWLCSWAKALQKVGMTPLNPEATDIKRTLEVLKGDQS